MVRIRFRHLLPILAALTLWLPAQAQLHRGARTIVRGGMLVQRDSLASKTDSLADLSLVRELDSLMTGLFAADSADGSTGASLTSTLATPRSPAWDASA